MRIVFSLIALWLAAALALTAGAGRCAETQDVEHRVSQLLSQMTLEEKIGQTAQRNLGAVLASPGDVAPELLNPLREGAIGSFLNAGDVRTKNILQRIAVEQSRLGIPLIYGRDVIHGYRTVFPIPVGGASSWNTALIERAARIAAIEASASGIHWTFAPMLDITRDPRWGRVAETCGEDPYLTSILGAAKVRGFQGRSLADPTTIAACGKHYVGYGAAEGGRDYNTTIIPERQLREIYLAPFHAAVEAGAATLMSAFNEINDVPASGNAFTLTRVLRGEWGFDGFVVSDWNSIAEMIAHGYCADEKEAAFKGFTAGVDMEMVSTTYENHLMAMIRDGTLDESVLDEAVRRILRIKFRLGLFDSPYRDESRVDILLHPDHLAVAEELAMQSAVLLENRNNTLPLSRGLESVAVIGPLADSPVDQMGTWTMDGRIEDVRTPLAAIKAYLGPSVDVLYAPGLEKSRSMDRSGFAAAVDAARRADAVLLFLGEEQILSGEAKCRAFLDLPGAQEALIESVAETGKPVIAVILAGRPLTFESIKDKVGAILYAWHPGTMGGPALAKLIFGEESPSGRLPISFPRTVGQIPVYYAHKNTGRPPSERNLGIPTGTPLDPRDFTSNYLDVDFTPAYVFGYGLSYAEFEYSDLTLSSNEIAADGVLKVSAKITNRSDVAADEVAQLYVRDLVASVTRPVAELKGFSRLRLEPGEIRTVSFDLRAQDLAFLGMDMQPVIEPGLFHIRIGPNSREGVRGEFRVR